MAALLKGALVQPVPAPEREAGPATRALDPAGITAGLAYVNRCLRGHRPFGIITGSIAAGLDTFLERITADCAARDDLHTVRLVLPSDSVQYFLVTCLAQLGFELRHATVEDLHKLMVVFLRHESTRGRRTVVIIEGTDQCGPHVLQFLEALSKIRAGVTPAMTFVLVGSPGLHRVLDSRGMSGLRQFTRERFDLDRAIVWVAPVARTAARMAAENLHRSGSDKPRAGDSSRILVVMLDGAIVERLNLAPGRLLIGRSPACGLRLDSNYVSRHHATLIVTPETVAVVDLRSTNSTLVNGQATVHQQLEHGDLLAIGNFRLRYESRPRPDWQMKALREAFRDIK